jgi:hypothetical protein
VVSVLGVSSVFRCGRVPPRPDAAATPPSPSISRRSLRRRGKGKPQWGLVAWTSGSQPPPLPLNPGAAIIEAKGPSCPGFDRPGGRGSTAPLCAGQDAEVRGAGEKGYLPSRAGFDSRVRAHQSLSVRAGRTGRGSCPTHARPRRGLPGAVRIRGEGNKDEDELLTNTRARSIGERKG